MSLAPELWRKIEELYHAALERPAGERAMLLAQADPEVRRQVEILLAQPSADGPIDRPAWDGMNSNLALAAGRKLGNFEIISLVGRGGMGEVYRARDSRLKREVAIKVLPESFVRDPERVVRFEREARAAGALNHPNIVTVYEVGSEGGTHWIASELVAGESLQELISRGAIAPRKAIEVGAQIAEGLAAAHAHGIVHRDLKPGNVMVTREGRVKILDFGLAKQRRMTADASGTATEDLTDTGMIMGTAAYMSPEQVRGEEADPRSDIFSLGLMLHEMLSGKRAFSGDSSVEVMNAILKEDPPELTATVPPGLARIVARCLEKDAGRRFQSAADLGFALTAISAPAAAAISTRGRRWMGVALGVGCVLLAAVSTWSWVRFRPVKPTEHVLTRLTANGRSFNPAISRDGKLLAYAAIVGGDKPEIWVQQVAGGKAIQITHEKGGAVSPSFSPDGTFIVYAARGGIYEVPALGGDGRLIASEGFGPIYTPDGSDVVFLRNTSFWYRLLKVPRMGGAPEAISPVSVWDSFALSPDGKKALLLAIHEIRDWKRWWTMSLSGGKLEDLNPPAGIDVFPVPLDWVALGPDHTEWAVFSRGVGDNTNLFRVRVSSNGKLVGSPEQLTATLGLDYGARVSGDGRMVFSNSVSSTNLWSIPMDADRGRVTGERQRLTQMEGVRNENVGLSRDGKKAVFERDFRVFVMDVGTGQETQLAEGTRPVISPDGSLVVYIEKGKLSLPENPRLDVISTMGGIPRLICKDCTLGGPKGFSADGSKVLAQGGTSHVGNVRLIDIASGESKTVLSHSQHSIWHPYYSWDDRWMTFKMQLDPQSPNQIAQHFRIYITPVKDFIPAGESQWIALTSGEYADDRPQLSPDGNTLYFVSNRDGYNCFWAQRLNPQTKHPDGAPFAIQHLHYQQSIPSPTNLLPGMELNVAKDKIVTNLGEFHSDIWMMQLPEK